MVSVVVPTFNRRDTLVLALTALLRTRLPDNEWEIVVADDGCTDGTDEAVARLDRENVFCVSTNRKDRISQTFTAAHARNVGLRAARGNVVAFMDDDILHLADPITTTEGAFRFEHGKGMVLCADNTFFLRGDESQWLMEGPHHHIGPVPCAFWFAVERDRLMEIGGYDERFTVYGAEDADLVARLDRLGLAWRWSSALPALHLPARHRDPARCTGDQYRAQAKIARDCLTVERNAGVEWGKPLPKGDAT